MKMSNEFSVWKFAEQLTKTLTNLYGICCAGGVTKHNRLRTCFNIKSCDIDDIFHRDIALNRATVDGAGATDDLYTEVVRPLHNCSMRLHRSRMIHPEVCRVVGNTC